MEEHFRQFGLTAALLLIFADGALSQSARFKNDPTFGPILKAEQEGRLVDAKKLIETAIQEAEAKSPPDPRLRALLSNLASIDVRMGHNAEAIAIAQHMLDMDEKVFGADSPRLMADLNTLGTFYEMAGDKSAAGSAFERALALARQNHGAGLLMAIGNVSRHDLELHRTAEAKALLTEAVEICDANPEPHFPDCSSFRTSLAEIYRNEGRPGFADEIVSRGAAKSVGAIKDAYTQMNDLNAKARQYEEEGSYDLAEQIYRQAIAIIEKTTYLKDKSATSFEFLLLGQLFEKEARPDAAEEAYKHGLELEEAAVDEHPAHAGSLLAFIVPLEALYRTEGRLSDLEPILQQALALQERFLGASHSKLAETLIELAGVYQDEQKYSEAEPLLERAVKIQETDLGPDSPRLLPTLERYAGLLRSLGELDKAKAIEARIAAPRQR